MNSVLEKMKSCMIVPVIALEEADKAEELAGALCRGGLPCAEVTFRTAAAAETIRRMRKAYPDMLVGAGTVLTTEQVNAAVDAGAQFIVSPGFNPRIVRYCIDRGLTIVPGTATPSEVEQAIEAGLEVVKFFPAEAAGGLNMIKSMSAPYGNMMFMPTGGINPDNVKEYLKFSKILACGGSWMVKKEYLDQNQFDRIEELAREAVKIAKEVR